MKPAKTDRLPEDGIDRIADRYRIEYLLGRGGMGTVYRAFDEREQRLVALKRLRPPKDEHKAEYLSEMFSREFRTLVQIAHPSVIRVFDSGIDRGTPYYTMELLEGNDLHDMAPVPWQKACAYLRDVSSCLALLHSRRLLHRDVSPRNVRFDDSGRAKLIDFGAMAPVGAGHTIVGTPPLLAPEVIHEQTLDTRCDLYALGGTLYWALTGRYAYPARSLHDLLSIWHIPPDLPSSIVSDIPKVLDELVSSLIAREVDARPRSAAEVMERLTAIANLEDDEPLRVSLSYLTTPSLIGREAQMKEYQTALTAASTGASCALFITGAGGVGRSRMLDACIVEARLRGIHVLRIQAMEIGRHTRSIGEALLSCAETVLPESQPVSSQRLDNQYTNLESANWKTPTRLLNHLQVILRHAATHKPLLIAIDDVHLLDAASQAMLTSLLRTTHEGLLMLLTVPDGIALQSPLDRLCLNDNRLVLKSLDSTQTQALLGSVFGDVPRLQSVSSHVHTLSGGNPRATMEFAQYLVNRGQAHYEMGGWCLPMNLQRDALPESWAATFEARLQALSEDERDLAEVLALTVEYEPPMRDIDRMTLHGDPARRATALDGLVASGFLRFDGEVVAFDSTAHREHLKRYTSVTRLREIYAHLAKLLEQKGYDEIRIAACLLQAGRKDEAIDRLLAELARTTTRWDTAPADYAEILQSALEAARSSKRSRRDCFMLLSELVKVGEHMEVAGMNDLFTEVFSQLTADGCLTAYASLPESMKPDERLAEAFRLRQAHYDALPENEQVYSPVEGVRALALAVRQAAAFATATMDQGLLDRLPSLAPFVALSPAIEYSVKHALLANGHVNAARLEQAYTDFGIFLERLREKDHAGLSDEDWIWTTGALEFAMGHLQAGLGISKALKHADILEQMPAWAITAWDVRCAYFLRLGDAARAESCRSRMEFLQLKSGRKPPLVGTSARLEMDIAADAGDLVAARRAMERMQDLIGLHPGYRVYRHYGPAVQEYIRGNNALALEHAERALEMTSAGRHPSWPWIANCYLNALIGLARYEEARERAVNLLAEAEGQGLRIMAQHVSLPLALAEAYTGQINSAKKRVEEAIIYRMNLGCQGLNLGWAYEHSARIAIITRDSAGFAEAAKHCADEYGRYRNGSSLFTRYEALRREARQSGFLFISSPTSQLPRTHVTTKVENKNAGFRHLFSNNNGELTQEKAEQVLELLLTESGAVAGLLYQLCGTRLQKYAAKGAPSLEPPPLESLMNVVTLDTCFDDDNPTCTLVCSIQDAMLRADLHDDDLTCTIINNPTPDEEQWIVTALGYNCPSGFVKTGVLALYFAHAATWIPLNILTAIGRALKVKAPVPKNEDK